MYTKALGNSQDHESTTANRPNRETILIGRRIAPTEQIWEANRVEVPASEVSIRPRRPFCRELESPMRPRRSFCRKLAKQPYGRRAKLFPTAADFGSRGWIWASTEDSLYPTSLPNALNMACRRARAIPKLSLHKATRSYPSTRWQCKPQ